MFVPEQILVPNTFCDGQTTSKLYTLVQDAFPTVTVSSVLRKHFRDSRGLQQIQHLCANEYSSIEIVVSQKYVFIQLKVPVYLTNILCICFRINKF
jgi:hypothetical protein